MKQTEMVFHTFSAEFRGMASRDVVQALYRDSSAVTGQSFSEWWQYQHNLWGDEFGSFPAANQPDACHDLLQILISAEVLEPGMRPDGVHEQPV